MKNMFENLFSKMRSVLKKSTVETLCMVLVPLMVLLAAGSCEKPGISSSGGEKEDADSNFSLQGTSWKLVGIVDVQADTLKIFESNIDDSVSFTITFNEDSTISGWGNCNEFYGFYETDANNNIYFRELMKTAVFCHHYDEEELYGEFLYKVRFFSIGENELKLYKDKQNYLLYKPYKY
ncbi:MAG: META domain-containing protein [Lentimicrobiaceae bacterium]|nr:META domain-containing protein [Lentimicrobiaceae bacterium]